MEGYKSRADVRVPFFSQKLMEMERDTLVGVEIGVWQGNNCFPLVSRVKNLTLYGIDPFVPYPGFWRKWGMAQWDQHHKEICEKAKMFDGRMIIIRKRSEDAIGDIPDGLDFLHIDGDHDYPFIKRDLELYEPKVRVGGIVSGHDYPNRKEPDVKRAVDEYADKLGVEVILSDVYATWWWRKK